MYTHMYMYRYRYSVHYHICISLVRGSWETSRDRRLKLSQCRIRLWQCPWSLSPDPRLSTGQMSGPIGAGFFSNTGLGFGILIGRGQFIRARWGRSVLDASRVAWGLEGTESREWGGTGAWRVFCGEARRGAEYLCWGAEKLPPRKLMWFVCQNLAFRPFAQPSFRHFRSVLSGGPRRPCLGHSWQESPWQTKPKKGPIRKVHEFHPFVNSGVFP